jgi:mono/diheme cytochrome c family protein
VKVVIAILLLLGGAAVGAVAVMLGLVPGFRVRSPIERLPDSTVAAADTQPAPAGGAADSVPLPTLADSAGTPGVALVITAADSADGEMVYRGAGRCLSCHGATGEGVAQLGPSLRDERWITGDGSPEGIARAVRDGVSPPKEFPIAMPAYARQLPEEAIARVAAYVFALSHAGAVQRDSLAPRPDSARVPTPGAPPGAVPRPTVPAPGGPPAAAPAAPRPTVPRPTVPRPTVPRPGTPR